MKRFLWLGILFLSASWLFFIPQFTIPDAIIGTLFVILGILCMIGGIWRTVPKHWMKYISSSHSIDSRTYRCPVSVQPWTCGSHHRTPLIGGFLQVGNRTGNPPRYCAFRSHPSHTNRGVSLVYDLRLPWTSCRHSLTVDFLGGKPPWIAYIDKQRYRVYSNYSTHLSGYHHLGETRMLSVAEHIPWRSSSICFTRIENKRSCETPSSFSSRVVYTSSYDLSQFSMGILPPQSFPSSGTPST